MKRLSIFLVSLLAASTGIFVYGKAQTCERWQDDYKRFMFEDMMRHGPLIYTPEDIEEIIGERPEDCARPTSLEEGDYERYRAEFDARLVGKPVR